MSETTDGGSAFPQVVKSQTASGMTLRDYFACHSLEKGVIDGNWDQSIQWRADCAYQIADAMLVARGGK